MKVLKVMVERLPKGCEDCTLKADYNDAEYYCAALATKEYKAEIPFGMWDFRRSDCPLMVDEGGAQNV